MGLYSNYITESTLPINEGLISKIKYTTLLFNIEQEIRSTTSSIEENKRTIWKKIKSIDVSKLSSDQKKKYDNILKLYNSKFKSEEEIKKKNAEKEKNRICNTIDQSIYSKVDFESEKDIDKIIIWINKVVLPKLLTSDYKNKIKEELTEIDNEYKNYMPTIKATKYDDDIIEVINDDQIVAIACMFVINDLADILYKAGIHVSTGDGDEGCLYL